MSITNGNVSNSSIGDDGNSSNIGGDSGSGCGS